MKMTPCSLYPHIEILKLSITVSTETGHSLSYYLGSTWRGIIGWELKALICPLPGCKDCHQCILGDNCPYYLLFEKRTEIPGIFNSPRGYVLFAPVREDSQRISLNISLFGYCCKFLPVILQALARAQSKGLGRNRTPFSIESISEHTPHKNITIDLTRDILTQFSGPFPLKEWLDPSENHSSEYCLQFSTPMRLRKKGKYLSDLDLKFMFMTLARRLEAMACIYSDGVEMGKSKWQAVQNYFSFFDGFSTTDQNTQLSENKIFKNMRWDDYSRFSNRQKRKVPMGGLVGYCSFAADVPKLEKWIKCAEIMHIGKGASMGLGRIERVC